MQRLVICEAKRVVTQTLKGFGGNACPSNLLVGVQSRGYDVETAQSLMRSALDNGHIKLDEEMRAVFPQSTQ